MNVAPMNHPEPLQYDTILTMNLWDEFDNQHLSHDAYEASEATRPRRNRRLTEQAMLSSWREWLLQDYVSSYCRSLATLRIYRRCYWIDAWGGVKGRNTIPPILQSVTSLSSTLVQEHLAMALHGIVLSGGSSGSSGNSGRPSQRTKTQEDTAISLRLPAESGVVAGNWLEVGIPLLKAIEQSPTIFLLNPFGSRAFRYDDLAPLYQRTTAPTELLLLLSHKQLVSCIDSASQSPEVAATLTNLLRTDRWKALLTKDESGKDTLEGKMIDGLIDLLCSSMERHFLTVQRIALSVQAVQAHRAAIEDVPYTLVFATRSKDSLISMNDALCLYQRRLAEQGYQGVLGEEWFAEQRQERYRNELTYRSQRIVQQGAAQRVRRWPDLRQYLLLDQFGRYTVAEYDESIVRLLAKGDLRCQWRRHEHTDIPGNDDTLLWK